LPAAANTASSMLRALWLVFSIRLWYCRNPSCSRKIFAESLAPFVGPQQQSSALLKNLQHQLGLIAGGEAGRRAAVASGIQISADTLLRRVVHRLRNKQRTGPSMSVLTSGHGIGATGTAH